MSFLVRVKCFKHAPFVSSVHHRAVLRRHISTTAALPAEVQQIQIPKIIVSPGSAHHNSLPSFLEYATRTNLAPSKTYYVGTHYEYTVALSLLRLGFSLIRTGRKSDAGIDLIGHWILPQFPEPLPVIVQCKVRTRDLASAPVYIRELEGAFQGIPADWRKKSVLGLLATTQKASKGVLDCLGGSRWPMGFMKISKQGTVEQLLWNRAASERGLEGVGVTVRHTPRIMFEPKITEQGEEGAGWRLRGRQRRRKSDSPAIEKDIQLTWMGNPIFPDRDGPVEETVRLLDQIEGEGEDAPEPVENKRSSKPAAASGKKRLTTMNSNAKQAATTSGKRGRPRKGMDDDSVTEKVTRGRGKPPKSDPTPTAARRGRPPGSKNKATRAAKPVPKRGRPPGSRNTRVKELAQT